MGIYPRAQWLRFHPDGLRPPGAQRWNCMWSPGVRVGHTFSPWNNSFLHIWISKLIRYYLKLTFSQHLSLHQHHCFWPTVQALAAVQDEAAVPIVWHLSHVTCIVHSTPLALPGEHRPGRLDSTSTAQHSNEHTVGIQTAFVNSAMHGKRAVSNFLK